ncbi:hypothetical protein ACEPAF_7726 [Sanghuangporus sanghuang]
MDSTAATFAAHQNTRNNIAPRYPPHPISQQHNHHIHQHQHNQQPSPPSSSGSVFPSIDVDALAAGVQRFLPGRPSASYPHNNSYITLPPGVDPATVDFRTFYPYNPSEVKHRKRTTRPQLKVLEDTFKRETKPNAALRKQLAAQLEMTPRGVQVWFQNRRAKEKNLAKKASLSSANGRKSINKGDGQKGDAGKNDADGDVDRDDGDGVADDDSRSNCEQPARPASQAPGTAPALDERKHSSYSSSTSPESTSPELTPPNGLGDTPHVNVNSPGEDDGVVRQPEVKQGEDPSGLHFPPSSWQGPQRAMSRTPTSHMGMEQGHDYSEEMDYGSNGMMPTQDQFVRRTSLPTVLGIGPSRVRAGYSPRLNGMSSLGMNAGRMSGFDPAVRRMSLDRLASHPYAHLAAQANSMVYGSSLSRYRPTLPATTHSTPTLTPQARTTDLPPINQMHTDGDQTDCNGNAGIETGSSNGMSDSSLPPHMHHPPMSPPESEARPELMHRQSLPAHLASPGQFAPSTTSFPPQPHSANPMSMRFPRAGHVYALSSRTYQPPIAGPLPNPDFSFGSVGNGESEGSQGDGTSTPDMQLQSSLNNFQFPPMDDGKDNNGSSSGGTSNSLDMEMESDPQSNLPSGGLDPRSAVYYRDSQGLHGAADPYASRFGSIASTVSITESESSVTSGACFSSEGGSNFDSAGYNDTRRASCTGSIMDMFSNLDVRNNSHSSLPHPHESRKPQDALQSRVPISRSSELALALMPENDNKSSIYGGDNTSNVNINVNVNDASGSTNDLRVYNRASLSSSDLSHGQGYGHGHGHAHRLGHRYPLAPSSRSAASSRSSFHMAPRLTRLETDKLDFIHNIDSVSETGHYSPVSHPSPAPFEFPLSEPMRNGMNHGTAHAPGHGSVNGSVASLHDMDQENNGMPSHSHHYGGVDNGQGGLHQQHQQQSQLYISGPYGRDGEYIPPHHPPPPTSTSSYSLHGHSQENVSGYGYYN